VVIGKRKRDAMSVVKFAVFSTSGKQLSSATESERQVQDWERWFASARLGAVVVDEVSAE